MKIIFDEWYGDISFAQRAAYRKLNISPYDHQMLCAEFGESNHAAITAAVKQRGGA